MRTQIENAIKSTLVIKNKESIGIAVDKIIELLEPKLLDIHGNLILGNFEEANKIIKELIDKYN